MSDYQTLHLDIHASNGTAILFCIICSHHNIAEILLDFKMLTPNWTNWIQTFNMAKPEFEITR